MAHSMGKGLAGLSRPGKSTPKGTASMTIEPMPPAAPKKPAPMGITPLQKAGPGWKAKPAIGSPTDVPAPKVTFKT